MEKARKNIIFIILMTVLPILITLPIALTNERMEFVEVALIITGCLELMAFTLRIGRRERKNIKKYNRYKTKETDEGFDEYRTTQNSLLISGVINILLSVIWFYIFL